MSFDFDQARRDLTNESVERDLDKMLYSEDAPPATESNPPLTFGEITTLALESLFPEALKDHTQIPLGVLCIPRGFWEASEDEQARMLGEIIADYVSLLIADRKATE